MKLNYLSITLLIITLAYSCISFAKEEFPVLTGPYLGQKRPGITAEIFAPGIVSINGRYEYGLSFSPDLKEVYFSTQKPEGVASIHASKREENTWQPIKRMSFTDGEKSGEMEPFVSLDNKKIYFTAYNSDFSDTKIWVSKRVNGNWGIAKKLDSPINDAEVFNSTLAQNGDLFYTDIFQSKTYLSTLKDGKYSKTKALEIEFGIHGFISPSQDYLLVDARHKNRKDKDIYVYFKQADGAWTKPINLGGSVNTTFGETVPSVTPDGKYLFFSRYNEKGNISNLYWVSTQIIEDLRPN